MRFFDQVTYLQARAIVTESFPTPSRAERVPIADAVGRVTAEPVLSAFDVPGEDRCLVDGCAVSSVETAAARDRRHVSIPSAVPVESGDTLPDGCDAVVMVEDLKESGGEFTTAKAARPGQHIRRAGAEVREGEEILPSGHRVRPDEVGALVTCGIEGIRVQTLRVALIPFGQGLVPPGSRPGPGEVIESNTARAAAFLAGRGVSCIPHSAMSGSIGAIGDQLAAVARDSDLVLVFGGLSKGSSDGTARVIGALGEILFHGVAMQPGRPTLVGRVGRIPVIAIPGYPFAAGVVLRELVAPLLCSWGFPPAVQHPTLSVELARPIVSEVGVDEFVPLTLGFIVDRWVAYPRARNPASHLADIGPHAFLHVPSGVEGYEAGNVHEVSMTAGERAARRTLLVHGAPGPGSDELVSIARAVGVRVELVGSRPASAFEALGARRCHIAVLEGPGGRPRLLCSRVLLDDPCVRAVTGAAGAIGYPIEFVASG
ncbi:MAG TPA: molybdopterin molybdenumtransferase MoeA [Methanoregulaceae archaeon]|nr:molybdopterin molybdenumtransferase MoeA [Methanoregulaceae archaeon]